MIPKKREISGTGVLYIVVVDRRANALRFSREGAHDRCALFWKLDAPSPAASAG
jgi:hypothetical protein